MKTTPPPKPIQPVGSDGVINPRWIAVLVIALGLSFLLGTSGFQT